MKKLAKIGLSLALIIGITACGNNNKDDSKKAASNDTSNSTQASEKQTIKIGVVGEFNDVLKEVAKRYEEKTGNKIEIVVFGDYNQPNEALEAGDIDLNAYQHKKFLEGFNKDHGTDLVSIGNTMLAPLGIYSKQYKSLDEVKDGDKVVIPNDASNGARALFLLQDAGLIKVNGKKGDPVTVTDISENPKKLEIIEVDASQTARNLESAALAVVNDTFALDSKIATEFPALKFEESKPTDDNPYVNIIVAKKDRKDDKVLNDFVRNYYQTDETKKDYEKFTGGAWIPAW
ncbi:MetQ/NlpA family ABC transporter substrate-binding protein [Anaerococcus sp. AGMB00486]|uniref:Lipoprotein n=2 Tax=Anaerococcus TaxID=165779 RepID=A0ABX2NBM1_9FIRM|nr:MULTISPECIES: MetQ/NlpA family ABC transporter substrate-binding protein [Anaerococcus]MDY3006633.1 MetQ/NlpA family ABC transporter substrate-binding protein [Anaerococcus porci]MSS78102.1 MetQ/NlpA family ABC transporter substrate-binding protein [Anaerococcus porci]NVF12094.1 MetQ/NlpA family ABC transporter substrate-binding protein [Anaerococcus faecalis]